MGIQTFLDFSVPHLTHVFHFLKTNFEKKANITMFVHMFCTLDDDHDVMIIFAIYLHDNDN